jgi:hypothetical protein
MVLEDKMSSPTESLVQRVEAAYQQLSSAAADLNDVSDKLTACVADLDGALQKLNLGLSVWVNVSCWDSEETYDFCSKDLGYAKIGGKWGIALRTVQGNRTEPDREDVEKWLFHEAPRALRLSAVEYLPGLLERLSKEAAKSTAQIKEKLSEAQEVATAVKRASERPRVALPGLRAALANPKLKPGGPLKPNNIIVPPSAPASIGDLEMRFAPAKEGKK